MKVAPRASLKALLVLPATVLVVQMASPSGFAQSSPARFVAGPTTDPSTGAPSPLVPQPVPPATATNPPTGPTPPPIQKGIQEFPCAQPIPPAQMLALDFGQLCRYENENPKLPPATDHRVIYYGDSITEFWGNRMPGIANDDIINRGVSGQTSAQMLVRFRADVLDLHPHIVHFLIGTNDIAGNTGPTSLKHIEEAIASMAEQARTHGIKVILGSVLPVKSYPWSKAVSPIPAIHDLNAWMSAYAAREGFTYVDYFSSLDDGQGGFRSNLANDGVHPNAAGYAVMAPIATDAIQRSMKSIY